MNQILPNQSNYDMGFPNAEEFRRACERGRLMAAANLAINPDKRLEMEQKYGTEFCRNRWPEAYLKEN